MRSAPEGVLCHSEEFFVTFLSLLGELEVALVARLTEPEGHVGEGREDARVDLVDQEALRSRAVIGPRTRAPAPRS